MKIAQQLSVSQNNPCNTSLSAEALHGQADLVEAG